MKLLIKFPTRGRPVRFLETLRLYSSMLSGKHEVAILVIIDSDDETMQDPVVRKAIDAIPGVMVQSDTHATKIEAINDDSISKFMAFDVLLLASDDMIPQVRGYDDVICSKMQEHFPNTDGVLWFNDGYTKNRLNTLCILGKTYYDRFGYIYHPEYLSLWCDNEFMDVSQLFQRCVYFDQCIIKHEHWANNKNVPKDERYSSGEKDYDRDYEVYLRHKKAGFGAKILSILICTMPKRASLFEPLLARLRAQIVAAEVEGLVEVLWESDNGEMTIGAKRNLLMSRSRAEYVCYLDDDDYIGDGYIGLIVEAIRNGWPDCVGIVGEVFMGNMKYKRFIHSIAYTCMGMGEAPEFFYRPPNHLNPIRRTIAAQHPFPAINRSEDTSYALSIAKSGMLKTQVMVDEPIYFYIPSWMRTRGMVAGIEKPNAM